MGMDQHGRGGWFYQDTLKKELKIETLGKVIGKLESQSKQGFRTNIFVFVYKHGTV